MFYRLVVSFLPYVFGQRVLISITYEIHVDSIFFLNLVFRNFSEAGLQTILMGIFCFQID